MNKLSNLEPSVEPFETSRDVTLIEKEMKRLKNDLNTISKIADEMPPSNERDLIVHIAEQGHRKRKF